MILICDGSGRLLGDRDEPLHEGDAVIVPPGCWHGFEGGTPRGFGALSVRSREARAGRNPRTGEPVDVRAKHVPFFKSGKELRERLNLNDD